MSKYHNLSTVINFEFVRTIKKPSFWAATLSFPILFIALFGIIFYSGQASEDRADKLTTEKFSITYQDDSGIIEPAVAKSLGASVTDDTQTAIDSVQSGKIDAFFHYPKDTAKDQVKIYAKDVGLFNNSRYDAVAKQLLAVSADTKVGDPQLIAVTKDNVDYSVTTYQENGERSAGWLSAVPPLIFLILFYFIIAMLGNNLLNSTVEEKENRVTEMILTTIHPTSLIVGKLIATLLAGVVQAVVLITPLVIAYFVLGSNAAAANLPDVSMIRDLVIDPSAMFVGFLIFLGGLLVFTGTLVAIGAVMPTAKEAGQWFSIAIVMMLIPFYIFQLILSDPNQTIVQAFTYFPYTSPVTAMLRNAFGSLGAVEASIVIVGLLVLGVLIIRLAVHLFQYGAMEYSNKLSLRRLFK